VVVNELRGQPAVALDGGLADHLRDLIQLALLGRELYFQLVELGFDRLVFLHGSAVELFALGQPVA
jgi:hypothetical protein